MSTEQTTPWRPARAIGSYPKGMHSTIVLTADNQKLARLYDLGRDTEAVARQMAAAPDLLAALEKCADFLATWRNTLDGVQMTTADFQSYSGLYEARIAIEKAHGQVAR